MTAIDPYSGGLLGLASGDALGAPHEGGPLARLLWLLIGRTRSGARRWTDDTRMALDLAESLLEHGGVQPDALARRFAASWRWSRGYGPGTSKVLRRIRRGEAPAAAALAVYPQGSYGNGAAMRAPVLALYYGADRAALVEAAQASARVTHAHPLGVEGALLLALAAQGLLLRQAPLELLDGLRAACNSPDFAGRLLQVEAWLQSGAQPAAREVVARLGNRMTAPLSCPTAAYLALRFLDQPFAALLQFAIRCGGDVDTIMAMAGALWGIHNGPQQLPQFALEARDGIEALAGRLRARAAAR